MNQMPLAELWQWALDESWSTRPTPPSQLHTRAFPPGTDPDEARNTKEYRNTHDLKGRRLSKRRDQIIGGPPFSRPFQKYLAAAVPEAPIHRALRKMRVPGSRTPQSLEFRVCWAIVEGRYPDAGILSWTMRAREDLIRTAAIRGLGLLFDLTQREIANLPDEADKARTLSTAPTT